MVNQTDTPPRCRDDRITGVGTTILLVAGMIGGAGLGWSAPSAGAWLGGYVDPTILLLVGLLIFEIDFSALRRVGTNLRVLAIAWLANFVLVPVIGFAIASLFFRGEPLLLTGLIIYFMAPCTDWFLAFTRMARGDTRLGAVLLPINMLTQLLLYPVYLHLFAQGAASVEAVSIGETMLQWVMVPFAAGVMAHVILRQVLPAALFLRLRRWSSHAVPWIVTLLIVEIFAANVGVILDHAASFAVMLAAVFLFFVATFLLGEAMARLAGLAYPQHALLVMTTAARNAPMMLGVTAIALPDQPLIYAAIVIGMLVEFPHLTALRLILLRSQDSRASRPGPPAHARAPAPRAPGRGESHA